MMFTLLFTCLAFVSARPQFNNQLIQFSNEAMLDDFQDKSMDSKDLFDDNDYPFKEKEENSEEKRIVGLFPDVYTDTPLLIDINKYRFKENEEDSEEKRMLGLFPDLSKEIKDLFDDNDYPFKEKEENSEEKRILGLFPDVYTDTPDLIDFNNYPFKENEEDSEEKRMLGLFPDLSKEMKDLFDDNDYPFKESEEDSEDDPEEESEEEGILSFFPHVYTDTPELIAAFDYPVEKHEVKTEDGHLLTMHRIPHGKGEKPSEGRPVAFLQHGLLGTSSDWVIMGPENGIAYILADAGYDVWMGNARGNQYSRSPATLSLDDSEFGKFGLNEMGKYDLPAEIDHVLGETGEQQVFYVSHSMGTTMFYVMRFLRPEYNDKIRAQFSLDPVGFNPRTPMAPLENQKKDLPELTFERPNLQRKFDVSDNNKFNHLNFLWPIDVTALLREKIMNAMQWRRKSKPDPFWRAKYEPL